MPTLNLQVGASSDDARQVGVTMSALNAVNIKISASDRRGGFRFTGVSIPQGSTIDTATMQVNVENVSNDDPDVIIYGEDADNTSTFTTTNNDITDRTQTTASTTWNSTGIGAGFQTTPSIQAIIQEIVDRPSFGESTMVILFYGQSSNSIQILTYDQSTSNAAKLDIDYTTTVEISTGSATLASTGQTATVTPGEVQISAGSATLASTGQSASVTPGEVQIAANSATLASSGQTTNVTSGLSVFANSVTLASSGQSATITPGEAQVAANSVTLASSGQSATITPGEIQIAANSATLASSGQDASLGNIWYVDSNAADDLGDGSESNPWKYINTHVNSLVAGDIMYLRGGANSASRQSYTETAVIAPTVSGSAGRPITITNYPDEFVQIMSPGAGTKIFNFTSGDYWTISGTDSDYHILIDREDENPQAIDCEADNITFEYCEIKQSEYDQLIRFHGTSDSCTIDNCLIYDGYDSVTPTNLVNGIQIIETVNALTISNTTMRDFSADCVQIGGGPGDASASATNIVIDNCTMTNGSLLPILGENAIDCKIAGTLIVRNCTFSGFRGTGTSTGEAFVFQNFSNGLQFYDNTITDCGGCFRAERPNIEIWGNLVYDMAQDASGTQVMWDLRNNNTFQFWNNTTVGVFGATQGFLFRFNLAPTVTMKNNIFDDTSNAIRDISAPSGANVTADYNCWSSGATQHWTGANDITPTDPGFRDETNDDYVLLSTSDNVDAGTIQAPYTDGYVGTAPDIGYWEVPAESSITANYQQLLASGQAIAVDVGTIQINASSATLASTGQTATTSPGEIQIAASSATLASTGQSATASPGEIQISAASVTLASTGQSATTTPGEIQVSANSVTLTTAGQIVTIALGSPPLAADVATLASSGQSATVTPGEAQISAASVTLASSGQSASVTPDVTITANSATLASTGQAATVIPGTAQINAASATLLATALVVTISAATQAPVALTLSDRDLTLSLNERTINITLKTRKTSLTLRERD